MILCTENWSKFLSYHFFFSFELAVITKFCDSLHLPSFSLEIVLSFNKLQGDHYI